MLIERNETLAGPLRHVIWFQIRCGGSAKDDLYDGLGIEEVFARWIGVDSIHPHCGRGGERYACFIEGVVKNVIHAGAGRSRG